MLIKFDYLYVDLMELEAKPIPGTNDKFLTLLYLNSIHFFNEQYLRDTFPTSVVGVSDYVFTGSGSERRARKRQLSSRLYNIDHISYLAKQK